MTFFSSPLLYDAAFVLILLVSITLAAKCGALKAISGMERRPVTLATSGFITEYVANTAIGITTSTIRALLKIWITSDAPGNRPAQPYPAGC